MHIPIRKAVRVLLLNDKDELLLMCVEDFDISSPEGKRNKRFWCTIGGEIETGESVEQAAIREIYEESGIEENEIEIGPVVWYSSINLVLKRILTQLEESFIVVKTKQNKVFLQNPTQDEQRTVKELRWFSLANIQKSPEVIFPIPLPEYFPDIISGKYPEQPIVIGLKTEQKK